MVKCNGVHKDIKITITPAPPGCTKDLEETLWSKMHWNETTYSRRIRSWNIWKSWYPQNRDWNPGSLDIKQESERAIHTKRHKRVREKGRYQDRTSELLHDVSLRQPHTTFFSRCKTSQWLIKVWITMFRCSNKRMGKTITCYGSNPVRSVRRLVELLLDYKNRNKDTNRWFLYKVSVFVTRQL